MPVKESPLPLKYDAVMLAAVMLAAVILPVAFKNPDTVPLTVSVLNVPVVASTLPVRLNPVELKLPCRVLFV